MTEPISAAISAEIEAARAAHGGTREDVAAAARAAGAPSTFTAAALRNLEIGRRAPSVDELLWLATALSVPVRQLLGEHRELFGHDAYRPPACGEVEDATRTAIEEFGDLTGRQRALAAAAIKMAAELDGSGERRNPQQLSDAIARRLTEIAELKPADTEQDDDLGAE
ncbi:hypothetical protein ACQEUV_33090 [Micromonospora aurantiaca (nom. illeg.)]|uniref:hypothetical protein n=1 Tax=Micromonospora aurantiaca (nom. illeg.) TaxID=47850 RepID=UPI003DA61881